MKLAFPLERPATFSTKRGGYSIRVKNLIENPLNPFLLNKIKICQTTIISILNLLDDEYVDVQKSAVEALFLLGKRKEKTNNHYSHC